MISRLRVFRFKIYTIVPIVRIDLQLYPTLSIEVVLVVRVVFPYDRPALKIIWDDWDDRLRDDSDDHIEIRLYAPQKSHTSH